MSSPHRECSAIDRLVAECRRDVDRVRPEDLAAEVAAGALVVDTRPQSQRERDGEQKRRSDETPSTERDHAARVALRRPASMALGAVRRVPESRQLRRNARSYASSSGGARHEG